MSSEKEEELRELLGAEVRVLQSATDAVDAATAARLGVNRTDLHCLDVLTQRESATPSELGAALGLTTGSVTAMLDRLARLGYLTRDPDPADRRKSVIRATSRVRTDADTLYGPLAADGAALLRRYSLAELELLLDFVRRSSEIQQRHAERLHDAEGMDDAAGMDGPG
ncbi:MULTISPECIES: MarR family transcriptional regulator [unclassified Streptomyces]|uniref:MarR family winged helix-turn-helix transcriptional regulator n=1 Tax=unclassified Streptomyces TaxID=2593676 RepID=UPI002DDC3FF8|nr:MULTISPECIES: MarR family transcriptional regulator [unclassified Streptomyces]WSA95516.1 MarR family transcriptional regulator [Streptomyces sp. NBC_01795]WSB79930.1 MarR family transcriptional regulator [Streptomyces sp. NBC_01775]WSS11862.1 MarR family transcriptional regulator [Streptomyces sp. NBC_01186]WSS40577.1 MarR family transcriptional regulator [Streptomyces sp. NBC_01187]